MHNITLHEPVRPSRARGFCRRRPVVAGPAADEWQPPLNAARGLVYGLLFGVVSWCVIIAGVVIGVSR
jgi:hypothetical protein